MDERRLLCVLAHPDDESLGMGSVLARYAAEGVATYLITATRGEHGWPGDPRAHPGPDKLGELRAAELRAAAAVLGVREVVLFDYPDGALDRADPAEVIGRLVAQLRRLRPRVVVTFGPDGATGHPDHIAISQFTTAAVVVAADPAFGATLESPPHRVAKLYYLATTGAALARYQAIVGDTTLWVDGAPRETTGWPDWGITTRIVATPHWRRVWQAVACHQTQLPNAGALASLPAETQADLWGERAFYRAFSLVNGGRTLEDDLFAGLD